MTNKPVYEIVKVLEDKIFIVGLGEPPISADIKSVYQELKKQFSNKRIIFIDEFSTFHVNFYTWWEMLDFTTYYKPQTAEILGVKSHKEIIFKQYNGKIPNIKIWDKILNPQMRKC